MQLNRYPTKTFIPKFSEVPKELSLFHYNTTIVDLKPFNPECDDYNDSYMCNYNELYPRIQSSAKKYLVNRNLNFYEPVKDAEIMAQLKSLRNKLKDPSEQESLSKPTRRGVLRYSKSLNTPEKNSMTNLAGSQKPTSSAYTEDMDKLNIQSEVVDGYLLSNKELADQKDMKENTDRTETNQPQINIQMIPIERPKYSKPVRPKSSKTVNNTRRESSKPANQQMDSDNYSLKSYNLSSFVSDKKGIKSPECNLDYYVNQGNSENELNSTHNCTGEHHNNTVITIPQVNEYERSSTFDFEDMAEINKITQLMKQKSAMPTRSSRRAAISRNRAHTSFNDNRKAYANKEITLRASFAKVPQSLPDIQPATLGASAVNRNIKSVLRKSTKSRLGNIYKTNRTQDVVENESNDPRASPRSTFASCHQMPNSCSCQSAVTRPTADYKTEIDTQDGYELTRYLSSRIRNKNLGSQSSCYKTVVITDTSKSLNKNPNITSNKRGFPAERLQRKEANPPTVQNIINDIPSTLNRMSLIGNVTNVEKLISKRLSEFYTTNRIIN